jgi:hypothetical protein
MDSCGTASSSCGQRLKSASSAHVPSIRAFNQVGRTSISEQFGRKLVRNSKHSRFGVQSLRYQASEVGGLREVRKQLKPTLKEYLAISMVDIACTLCKRSGIVQTELVTDFLSNDHVLSRTQLDVCRSSNCRRGNQ